MEPLGVDDFEGGGCDADVGDGDADDGDDCDDLGDGYCGGFGSKSGILFI